MPSSNQFQPLVSGDLAATIPASGSASGEIDLSGCTLCGIYMPAAMTGSSLSIQGASAPGGAYAAVEKDETGGGDYAIAFAAGKYVPISNLALLSGLRFIKLVSNASEASSRTYGLAVRPI